MRFRNINIQVSKHSPKPDLEINALQKCFEIACVEKTLKTFSNGVSKHAWKHNRFSETFA